MVLPPQDGIQQPVSANQRMIAPRIASTRAQGMDGNRASRDDRRRATHNEGECSIFII